MSWLPRNRVLVPIDFSVPSIEALALAKELVREPSGLYAMHVMEFGTSLAAYPAPTDSGLTEQRDTALAKLREVLAAEGLQGAEAAVLYNYRHGSAGITIARYANDVGAELIVIPTHGYTGLKRLMLGSVAQQVLHHAECPVLLLPRTD